MLCEKCKKNIASVHIEQIINSVRSEKYLCDECARLNDISFSDDEVSLFNSKMLSLFDKRAFGKRLSKFCPSCGLTLNEFLETSFLGCPQCYSSFEKEIDGMLENMQVRTKYIGKGISDESNK